MEKNWNILHSIDEITEDSKSIFEFPRETQTDNNLTAMGNYFPLIMPILESMQIDAICEIGADNGYTTTLLSDYTKKQNADLYVVDPVAPDSWDKTYPDHVDIFRTTSIDFLSQKRKIDVYFIDGDHNFYTVLEELRLVKKNKGRNDPCLILLHDISWPCAYRDMYYDKSNIPNPKKTQKDVLLFPTTAGLSENCGYPFNLEVVELEGGPENGVKCAVDHFLKDNSASWRYFDLPSIYGLGVLWSSEGMPEAATNSIMETEHLFSKFRPFLSVLELNRLVLLSKVNSLGEEGKQLQIAIESLKQDKAISDKYNAQLLADIETLVQDKAISDQYSAKLQQRLKDIGSK